LLKGNGEVEAGYWKRKALGSVAPAFEELRGRRASDRE
jgi:hypothetical protein